MIPVPNEMGVACCEQKQLFSCTQRLGRAGQGMQASRQNFYRERDEGSMLRAAWSQFLPTVPAIK